jgi:enoyl-CoA hydratase/carnithine racemase
MMLSGETVGPGKAVDLGIANRIFPAEAVLEEAKAYALKLANGPTKALAFIKRCVHEGIEQSLADGLALERELVTELFASEDVREGLTAFVEKRKPEFKGR